MNQLECVLLVQAIKEAHPEIAESITQIENKFVNQEQLLFRHFRASLRIQGDGLSFEEISRTLGLMPTGLQRKGERKTLNSKPREQDLWLYEAPVDRERPLDEHILAIWNVIQPHVPYLRKLKEKFKVDVFCGYRSNSNTAGFNVDYRCLDLFTTLGIPFGVSVIIS